MIKQLKKIATFVIPPSNWKLAVILIGGILVGLASYVLYISRFTSYFSDSPRTCVNCHIMAPQYATWSHSAHREATTCNDCHVPNDNFFKHYFFKAKDGMRHATIFTLRKEPQVIHIKEAGKGAVLGNCLRCHEKLFTDTRITKAENNFTQSRRERPCWECHRETPHGRVNSLSSVPNARVPLPESPVPSWLKTMMN